MPLNSPRLWIVATPIGNPGDLSARARDTLANADIILAEDTRRADQLCKKAGISPKKLLSFFEHNEKERQSDILQKLKAGENIALITDAGTPLLADPGYRLVRACRAEGIAVSPVPGPSAPIAALSASGLPPIPFTFLGFLPRQDSAKRSLFQNFAHMPGSLIFFERKNRICDTLEIAYKCLGNREVAICREITKEHEEFAIGALKDINKLKFNPLGEMTVIIGPQNEVERTPEEQVNLFIDAALDEGLKPKVAARQVAEKCSGWNMDEIYNKLIEIRKKTEE